MPLPPAPQVFQTLRSKAMQFSDHAVQSRMRLDDPFALDLDYTRLMMAFLLFQPDPVDIAMIGLGGGSLAKFCHRQLPRARLQVVEISPQVIALRDEFQVPPDDARLAVACGDGADFVRDTTQRFDVLLVDGFDAQGQPARLATQRFYDDCHDCLRPGGVLAVNLHSGDPRHALWVERIQRSFEHGALLVDDGGLGNSLVFACRGAPLRQRSGRRPAGLRAGAAAALQEAFAQVADTLREHA